MPQRAWFAYAFALAACTGIENSDVESSVATCDLADAPAVCTAPVVAITASTDEANATPVAADTTYSISGPNHGYVVFVAAASGTHTLYSGDDEPARVCDLDASCKAHVSGCGDLHRAAQYDLQIGEHYLIEVHAGANPFALHIASPASTVKLGAAQSYSAGTTPYYVTAADLDADGALDLVVSSPDDASGMTTVDLLQGSGTGAFAMQNQVLTSAPGETVVSDFDGNGTADVVGVAWDGQGALPAFYLQGQGAFAYTTTTWGNGRAFLARLDAADFDEDGVLDLVAPYADPDNAVGGFAIVRGFVDVQDDPAFGPDTVAAIAGDFDGDGHADVVAASRTTSVVRTYTGDGTGVVTFASQLVLPGGPIKELAAADLDGDGSDDLVAIHADGTVTITRSLGSSEILAAGSVSARGIGVGDFDHDGRLDLAIGNAGSEDAIGVFLATNAGFVRGATLTLPGAWRFTDLAVGDFDGDGFDDLATTSAGGVAIFLSTP